MEDPWVKGSGWKPGEIAPAKCYMDNIEAWSANECTINWNSPLAWLSAYLSQQGGGIVITQGSMDAGSNITAEAPENNDTPGSYKAEDYENVEKSSEGSSNGGWGLVPVYMGLTFAVLVVELTIFLVTRSNKKSK